MSNHQAGHNAEKRAANYLESQDFQIHQLNWKTKYCEIDIVAEKANTIYFVEVKYRRTTNQGYGLDYITPKKLNQMTFAAELWVHAHAWRGDYQLAVLSIDGRTMTFIEDL